ncbi:MAG TPA: hypothetical protein VIO64_08235 [Pseudobacteroides sp.]|uniref:hypothetical protein n=1 Tax=Pseudobacteroides sp. TaxID=1968840 RepID=UPI002F9289E2
METYAVYIISLIVSILLIFIGNKEKSRILKLSGIITATFLASIPILAFIAGVIDGARGR